MIKESLIALACLTLVSSVYGNENAKILSTEFNQASIQTDQLVAQDKTKKPKKSDKKKDKKKDHPHSRHKAKEQYAPKPKIPMKDRA